MDVETRNRKKRRRSVRNLRRQSQGILPILPGALDCGQNDQGDDADSAAFGSMWMSPGEQDEQRRLKSHLSGVPGGKEESEITAGDTAMRPVLPSPPFNTAGRGDCDHQRGESLEVKANVAEDSETDISKAASFQLVRNYSEDSCHAGDASCCENVHKLGVVCSGFTTPNTKGANVKHSPLQRPVAEKSPVNSLSSSITKLSPNNSSFGSLNSSQSMSPEFPPSPSLYPSRAVTSVREVNQRETSSPRDTTEVCQRLNLDSTKFELDPSSKTDELLNMSSISQISAGDISQVEQVVTARTVSEGANVSPGDDSEDVLSVSQTETLQDQSLLYVSNCRENASLMNKQNSSQNKSHDRSNLNISTATNESLGSSFLSMCKNWAGRVVSFVKRSPILASADTKTENNASLCSSPNLAQNLNNSEMNVSDAMNQAVVENRPSLSKVSSEDIKSNCHGASEIAQSVKSHDHTEIGWVKETTEPWFNSNIGTDPNIFSSSKKVARSTGSDVKRRKSWGGKSRESISKVFLDTFNAVSGELNKMNTDWDSKLEEVKGNHSGDRCIPGHVQVTSHTSDCSKTVTEDRKFVEAEFTEAPVSTVTLGEGSQSNVKHDEKIDIMEDNKVEHVTHVTQGKTVKNVMGEQIHVMNSLNEDEEISKNNGANRLETDEGVPTTVLQLPKESAESNQGTTDDETLVSDRTEGKSSAGLVTQREVAPKKNSGCNTGSFTNLKDISVERTPCKAGLTTPKSVSKVKSELTPSKASVSAVKSASKVKYGQTPSRTGMATPKGAMSKVKCEQTPSRTGITTPKGAVSKVKCGRTEFESSLTAQVHGLEKYLNRMKRSSEKNKPDKIEPVVKRQKKNGKALNTKTKITKLVTKRTDGKLADMTHIKSVGLTDTKYKIKEILQEPDNTKKRKLESFPASDKHLHNVDSYDIDGFSANCDVEQVETSEYCSLKTDSVELDSTNSRPSGLVGCGNVGSNDMDLACPSEEVMVHVGGVAGTKNGASGPSNDVEMAAASEEIHTVKTIGRDKEVRLKDENGSVEEDDTVEATGLWATSEENVLKNKGVGIEVNFEEVEDLTEEICGDKAFGPIKEVLQANEDGVSSAGKELVGKPVSDDLDCVQGKLLNTEMSTVSNTLCAILPVPSLNTVVEKPVNSSDGVCTVFQESNQYDQISAISINKPPQNKTRKRKRRSADFDLIVNNLESISEDVDSSKQESGLVSEDPSFENLIADQKAKKRKRRSSNFDGISSENMIIEEGEEMSAEGVEGATVQPVSSRRRRKSADQARLKMVLLTASPESSFTEEPMTSSTQLDTDNNYYFSDSSRVKLGRKKTSESSSGSDAREDDQKHCGTKAGSKRSNKGKALGDISNVVPKQGKKRKQPPENIEDIYLNKIYKKPEEKPWETIFESPSKDAVSDLFGKKRFIRSVNFDQPAQMKLRRRAQKAVKNGWDPKKRKRFKLSDDIVEEKIAIVQAELASLDED